MVKFDICKVEEKYTVYNELSHSNDDHANETNVARVTNDACSK